MGNRTLIILVCLLTLAGCEQTRIDAIAQNRDDLVARCIDAALDMPGTDWRDARLTGANPRVTRDSGGLLVECPYRMLGGQKATLKVIVVCPPDSAVPCESFATR